MFETSPGNPYPLGTTSTKNGVNFSLYYRGEGRPILHLFAADTHRFLSYYPLYQTGLAWHIEIIGLDESIVYAYKVEGAASHWISDPYAKVIASHPIWKDKNTPYLPFCATLPTKPFSWEDDAPPLIPKNQLIIYEIHVRGFTIDPSSHVTYPGTYLGLIEKIPYLLELGINAVELLPVQEFNELEYKHINPKTKEQLCNFWGYSTVNYFAPMVRYQAQSALTEFKQMVKALHANGIEVILDIVFNHTAEGNEKGPTYSYKALDKKTYYLLDGKGDFVNLSGCGNTFNISSPIVQDLVINALRYWVSEMHVDGFRFDLASILTIDETGNLEDHSSLITRIAKDPILANTKLIAEPWNAVGAYQLAFFSEASPLFSEWNDQYRDTLRSYLKGTPGAKEVFATRLAGSQDIFHQTSPLSSINYVTSHDGFTLLDLVSYQEKHNLANGENNQDGTNGNISWNCGVEGETARSEINTLRDRQRRNFHLALMLSQGIPMLFMGDEVGHTRYGNNNAWCQDNNLNWLQWDSIQKDASFFRFYRGMIHFRKAHPILNIGRFLTDQEIEWLGTKQNHIQWQSNDLFLAFYLRDAIHHTHLFAAFNPQENATSVEIPFPPSGTNWYFVANTGKQPPEDFWEPPYPCTLNERTFKIKPFSAILLIAS